MLRAMVSAPAPALAAVDGYLANPFEADQLVTLIHSRLAVALAAA